MLLYGASGHAKVILSCLFAANQPVTAIFDDDPAKSLLWRVPVVGSYRPDYRPDLPLLITIGANHIRQRVSQRITHQFGRAVHPLALVDPSVTVGDGSVVLHGAVTQADTILGQHCIVNTGACVDHDCWVGDFVHVAPNATLCGTVQVGEGTLIGAGAVVMPNLTIGRWVSIGAGAVVTKSVPDYAVVVGNPGRIVSYSQSVD
jgi:sugar O-acyltransferase (sialic acid O-acetyltransferase NeuD family)